MAPIIGSTASHFSWDKRGRKRNDGNRPQTNPPTWAATEIPAGEATDATMVYIKNANTHTSLNTGLSNPRSAVRLVQPSSSPDLYESSNCDWLPAYFFPYDIMQCKKRNIFWQCSDRDIAVWVTYLVRVRKFMMRSAMKSPISPKIPPLAPTTGSHPLSSTPLKNPPTKPWKMSWLQIHSSEYLFNI